MVHSILYPCPIATTEIKDILFYAPFAYISGQNVSVIYLKYKMRKCMVTFLTRWRKMARNLFLVKKSILNLHQLQFIRSQKEADLLFFRISSA